MDRRVAETLERPYDSVVICTGLTWRGFRSLSIRWLGCAPAFWALALTTVLGGGCGETVNVTPAPLLSAPFSINGEPAGKAIIDTGGAYELMLRDTFGLEVTDTVEVLAFGGRETVGLVNGFEYEVGGLTATADVALVGLSTCDCNGVGFFFLRKTGALLHMNFADLRAEFGVDAPAGGVELPFEPPPDYLPNFDSAFITVEVSADGEAMDVLALLDTGTNGTVLRRGLIGEPDPLSPNRLDVQVTHPLLGTVSLRATLFDTDGLPDMILGTDVMQVWSSHWYFHFAPRSGLVVTFPARPDGSVSADVADLPVP